MNNKQKTISGSSDLVLKHADAYAHAVYLLAKRLPRSELFGLTSQLRRAALSVPLNIVEGFARQSAKNEVQFLKIAYGSLKEAQFIIKFAIEEQYLSPQDAQTALKQGESTAKLIWVKTKALSKQT